MACDRAAYPRQRARHSVPVPELHLLVRADPRGRDERSRERTRRHASATPKSKPAVWRMYGTTSGCRLRADASRLRAGDYDRASALLQPILADVPCVGGSDEQRGVFRRVASCFADQSRAQGRGARRAKRPYKWPARDRARAPLGRTDLARSRTHALRARGPRMPGCILRRAADIPPCDRRTAASKRWLPQCS